MVLRSLRWLRVIVLLFVVGPFSYAACDNQAEFVRTQAQGRECRFSEECEGDWVCSPEQTCIEPCPTCGNICEKTPDCPSGQHCAGDDTCQSECRASTADPICGTNNTCSADGECIPVNTIEPVGSDGGAGGASELENEECIDVDVSFAPEIPSVVLLIDQSGSMSAEDGFGQAVHDAIDIGQYQPWDCGDDSDWRWNVVRNILLHPETGVVKPLEDDVRFGLALYSSEGGFDGNGGVCPTLNEVEIGFGNQASMLTAFECSDIIEDTPTRESLAVVAEELAALSSNGPKVIVLATDGAPDNCTCFNWREDAGPNCADSEENIVTREGIEMFPSEAEQYDVMREAQRIHEDLGIQVEVIDVSSPTSGLKVLLDQVAQRGGATSGASIAGFDPESLSLAFKTIIDGARSCAVDLDGEITKGRESTGQVLLDEAELNFAHPDGWRVNTPTQIELVGAACEVIKSGDHDIDISFPCDSYVPVPVH